MDTTNREKELYWFRKALIARLRDDKYSVRQAKDYADRNAAREMQQRVAQKQFTPQNHPVFEQNLSAEQTPEQ
jgi:hypothetical protein